MNQSRFKEVEEQKTKGIGFVVGSWLQLEKHEATISRAHRDRWGKRGGGLRFCYPAGQAHFTYFPLSAQSFHVTSKQSLKFKDLEFVDCVQREQQQQLQNVYSVHSQYQH